MNDFIIEKDWYHKDFRCVVIISDFGTRCGYVGVERDNLWFGKYCNEDVKYKNKQIKIQSLVNVYGGITYSGGGIESDYPVKSNLWWFGFDCIHPGDARDINFIKNKRLIEIYCRFNEGVIRDLDFCIKQCEGMVNQIIEYTNYPMRENLKFILGKDEEN